MRVRVGEQEGRGTREEVQEYRSWECHMGEVTCW